MPVEWTGDLVVHIGKYRWFRLRMTYEGESRSCDLALELWATAKHVERVYPSTQSEWRLDDLVRLQCTYVTPAVALVLSSSLERAARAAEAELDTVREYR